MEQKYLNIAQIGIVVENMETTIGAMKNLFHMLPDTESRAKRLRHYGGKDVEVEAKIATYQFANIEVEFIEPVSGESLWHDYLREHGSGAHHIQFSVSDYEEAVSDFQKAGYQVSMSGDSVRAIPGLKWAYFDTERDLGLSMEVFNDREVEKTKS